MVVLDEADRMFDMGFRADVEQILHALPKPCQTALRNASGPPKTRVFAGFWGMALANPNRRLRVPGADNTAARVFLCCQVGRFGFAFDSPEPTAELPRLGTWITTSGAHRFQRFIPDG